MRSHLTRNVFRRLLASEGFYFRCPYSSISAIRRGYEAPMSIRAPSRRTLFGFSPRPPRRAKETDLDPGLSPMLDLMMTKKVRARPPPASDLIDAFNTFFAHKMRVKEAVNRIQAEHALRTFRHLRDTNSDEEGFGLTLQDLKIARDAMLMMPMDKKDLHNVFAREIFAEISKRKVVAGNTDYAMADLVQYVTVLIQTGDSMEARTLAQGFSSLRADHGEGSELRNRRKTENKLWHLVLRGFALEMNEKELLNTAQLAEDAGIPYNPTSHKIMSTFFARRNDIQGTKACYEKGIMNNRPPSSETMSEVLQFCLRNDELEWCNSIFKQLLETNPDKPTWDVIFQWAAGALGKGVEDVEHMMDVMIRYNKKENSHERPDTETINGLVALAMSKKDPYLAERYLGLGLRSGILPNAKTYILQMDYRIDAGDLRGAQAAYELLQAEEIVEGEDLPVINKYIRALCSSRTSNYDRIVLIATDLEERKVRLEADTVSALCLMYLKRDEIQDVLDLLNTHTFHYTLDERTRVRDAFLAFCFDRGNSTLRVWDAYTIIRQIFDETDTATRTKLMTEFFDRKRCDMACHIFGHMRQHMNPEKRPTSETYIICLEGIARSKDTEHLDMVHNMMKMDSSIEPSTRLYNALMLAYTACDEPYRALDFWTDITNSREGPTYASLQLVFQACEIKPFGDKPAKEIWNKMRRMEIEVTPEVFSAYVGALAGQALGEEVKALIDGVEADLGFGPDLITLGTFYNASPGQNRKDDVEAWAKERYPTVWTDLEKVGQRTTDEGERLFQIVREVRA
ncbi:MAG: hypothetical protein M1818_003406 [Claussenomyces sp. TS43310]|nr:MAG: hypothetical protein M1818_003406 [Claussenomyces sp. TS43310]